RQRPGPSPGGQAGCMNECIEETTMEQTNRLTGNGHDARPSPARPAWQTTHTPRVDVLDTGEELTLYADLPGVRAEDLQLRWDNNELVLSGRPRPRDGQDWPVLHEYTPGEFRRAFRVTEDVDPARISAEMKNGVLTLHLPRSDRSRPRKIDVQGS